MYWYVYFVGPCRILDLWDWWKSPFPLGVVCSDGSQCRGQLQTQLCDHQDTPVRSSSCPASRSLTHKTTPVSSGRGCRALRKRPSGPTLGHRVRLHVPIVVFAGPNEAAVRFHSLGHHVVDQAMLIPDASVLKVGDVFPEDTRAETVSSLLSHFTPCVHSVEIVYRTCRK